MPALIIDEDFETGSTPWTFTAQETSNGTVTLETSGGIGNSKCLTFATTSAAASKYARMQQTVAWAIGTIFSTEFWVKLPSGFYTAMTGSVKLVRHDPFPQGNNHSSILISDSTELTQVWLKTDGTETQLGDTWAIPENQWVHIRWVEKLANGTDGWVRVHQDGVLVSSADGVDTMYNDGSNGITRIRWGMVATEDASQTNALSLQMDEIKLSTSTPLYFGSNPVDAVYVGSDLVDAIYIGADQVL